MRCISPLLIRTNGRRDFVPCGKCNYCLETKRNDWSFRLAQEQKVSHTAAFLTLTYDNTPVSDSGVSTLVKRDLQLFTKRLRKFNSEQCPWPLRYYSVGEYGTNGTNRAHYHSIMFNIARPLLPKIKDIWGLGMVKVGTVEPASIHYVTKYVINRPGEYQGREPPFAMMSKRPGIGSNYTDSHKKWHRADMRNFTQVNGQVGRLPRYYKEKFFNELERQKLAVESIEHANTQYWEILDALSKHHPDPAAYYDERIRDGHEKVTSKINDKNKL